MSANRYTKLFFLDEAVAFAAGHRPCAECRRERYNAFKDVWQLAHRLDESPFADDMDLELHPARIDKRRKVTQEAALGSLPDG
jgi:methylphosphotriester-DNA--protein-cysteine methyltransferase